MDQSNSIDLRLAPVFTKATEQLREKIEQYVERMNYAGKPIEHITVFASDFDTALGAINRARNKGLGKDAAKPAAVTRLSWGGDSRVARPLRAERAVTS